MKAFRSGEGRPFARLSDRAAGALAIGGIGVFEEDPGADYIKPDGVARLRADFSELSEILPVGSKMLKAVGAEDVKARGAYGQTILLDNDIVASITYDDTNNVAPILRSTDKGATYSRGARPSGGTSSLVRFGTTPYWYALKQGNFAQSASTLSVSSDRGLTWADQVIAPNSTVTTVSMFFLGAPWNLMFVTAQSNQNVFWYASAAGGAFNGIAAPIQGIYHAAVNPATGTVIFAGSSGVRRRTNPLDPVTTSTPSVNTGTLGGFCVRYAAGIFVVAGTNGVFVSRDDGNSFTQVSATGVLCCDYGNGIWLFGSGNGIMLVGNATLSAVSEMSFLPLTGAAFAFADLRFTGTSWIAGVNVLGSMFYSLTADPQDGFIIPPFLSDAGLRASGKYFMRAR